MHGDLTWYALFGARFVSTLFSTLKDVKKLVTITTTKESSSCFRKNDENIILDNHFYRSQNPKTTKIGDRFIVDISEIFTFSDSLVLVGSNFENHLFVLLSGIHPSRTIT